MTTLRLLPGENPINAWVRAQTEKLDSRVHFWTVNDVDFIFVKYRLRNDQGVPDDGINLVLFVEGKCQNKYPTNQQRCTLFLTHQRLKRQRNETISIFDTIKGRKVSCWFLGVFLFMVSDWRPDDSAQIKWGYFVDNPKDSEYGHFKFHLVNEETLVSILALELNPYNPEEQLEPYLRRHHAEKWVVKKVWLPVCKSYTTEVVRQRS